MNRQLTKLNGDSGRKKCRDPNMGRLRLFCTEQMPQQQCALLYTGSDENGKKNAREFAAWLFPWLQELREGYALAAAGDHDSARNLVRLFAGPIEVLRFLGSRGSLTWSIAYHMVGGLPKDHDYHEDYFEGGAAMVEELLKITVAREDCAPNVGPLHLRPISANFLIEHVPLGVLFRRLLQSLQPEEQIRVLEQLADTGGYLQRFAYPFEPLTC